MVYGLWFMVYGLGFRVDLHYPATPPVPASALRINPRARADVLLFRRRRRRC